MEADCRKLMWQPTKHVNTSLMQNTLEIQTARQFAQLGQYVPVDNTRSLNLH